MMTPDSVPQSLIQVAHQIGKKAPVWTQGFGGNVSFKQDNLLWVKSSGYRLDALQPSHGVVAVRFNTFLAKLAALFLEFDSQPPSSTQEATYAQLLVEECLTATQKQRPSMETGFHAVLPKSYVLHFHSLASLLMAYHFDSLHPRSKEFQKWLSLKWDSDHCGKIQFYPLLTPGLELAKAIQENSDAAAHILENHGIVLQMNSLDLLEQWTHLEIAFARDWNYPRLFKLLTSSLPSEELSHHSEEWASLEIPLKIYFPDTAVFLDTLSKVLKPSESNPGTYCLPKERWDLDKNMTELWLATLVLHKSCPQLKELNANLISSLSRLPTEVFRKLQKGSLSEE